MELAGAGGFHQFQEEAVGDHSKPESHAVPAQADSRSHEAGSESHVESAPAHSHAAAAHGGHEQHYEVFDNVSEAEVPSARWGWSMLKKRGVIIAGLLGGLFLLAMLFGNHKGNVENYWLIGLAIVTFLGTLWVAFQPTLTQKQTVTARNQPVGHVEPEWARDQHNLTGVYAKLTREELAALNQGGHEPESH
ncbi:DUF2631 domain-containing protein [Corynebacterium heidelbergense]|uniref:DUF2631 domain-containing protein n=1 Tax=Corynebacterium heidelbergense TaxID=2055947 RepID=A0A364V4M1_9CORY|nr:DUF2631 domain-containing protein [Corynebacterium heidelbergense]RAV31583.1 DUF2631 domain-containing protein [Corynebacterium heidelbergense]